jgi:hypothetical protein
MVVAGVDAVPKGLGTTRWFWTGVLCAGVA